MNSPLPPSIGELDQRHCWHPFTPLDRWLEPDRAPLVLVSGEGALLRDAEGREYLDGNSSIWTNLHGHRHPRLDAALRAQLDLVAHTSFLGFTHPAAVSLAAALADLWPAGTLERVFFSDNGSTAMEVALKIAVQFWQQTGKPNRTRFVTFDGAYHGDTMGASSLGGISLFHERFAAWQFPVEHVGSVEELVDLEAGEIAAVVIEPLIQGAAGMRIWPAGMLRQVREWCDAHGALLIADEVMTGFGRTGTMFASEREGVVPDLVCLAKGLTGGYMPLAATMVARSVFDAFIGGPERTLYYGHSYTGNALGCALALENLAIFREERVLERLQGQIDCLEGVLAERLSALPWVWEIRQCGFIAGIELRDAGGAPFPPAALTGARVCEAARAHGLLTRPIRDVLVLMLPYCVSGEQIARAVDALRFGIEEVCAERGDASSPLRNEEAEHQILR